MVGATRGTPSDFSASGSGTPPPPPSPPGFAEVLAAQTELFRQIVQGQKQRDGYNIHQPQAAGYQDFLGTQPPLFHVADEPLDADAWIHTIESNFSLLVVPCSEANKAHYAT
jgi:hypothetical protein